MLDRSTLEAALVGLTLQRQQIEEKINGIRQQLGGRSVAKATLVSVSRVTSIPPKRRRMSAAAKKRIADAQKKRWAEYHAKNAPVAKKVAAKSATPKKRLSPERRAQLAANLARARQAKAAKRKAA